MSASREKKIRQDLASQEGYIDPKVKREQEEKSAQRKSRTLYVTIGVIFVVVALVLAVFKSGVLEKNATAVTIDGEKFTPAQVDYLYYNLYNSIRNSQYASYMGLDSSTPLDKQNLNDMAKMLLDVTSEEDITWDAYLKNTATNNLKQVYALSKAAEAEGYTMTEELQAVVDSNVETISTYADSSGYSVKEYLKLLFGKNMTLDTFKEMLSMSLLAQEYQTDYVESLTYNDSDLEAYYQSDKECFDFADYEYIYFSKAATATTDADGNAVEPTEAETAAAETAAKDAVADAAARYAAGESLSDIAASYPEIANYSHADAALSDGSSLSQWVFDSARVSGDTTTIDDSDGCFFALFHSCGRADYPTVNVRHILFMADTSALDSESATYEADSQAIWDKAKARAEDTLDQWKAGEATAESFAQLAMDLSEDTGSIESGGLISDINKTSNYVTSFKDWAMDSSRQVGDTEIVESPYGYHVMYLDSFGDAYWKQMVTSELEVTDYNAWLDGILSPLNVEQGAGMKYVG